MQPAPALEHRLRGLLRVFLAENEKLNLSALRTEERCWTGNILDSLGFLDTGWQLEAGSWKLLDIGTGGGFPLLPLAIAMPEVQCTGLDAVAKKIRAVERIAGTLGLRNVHTVTGRAEAIGRSSAHRQQYDVVTSRAVAPLPVLLEYTAPFVRDDGYVVLWKSMHCEAELDRSRRAQEILHCNLERTHRYTLPDLYGERQLLIFRKTAPTPEEFPREVGMAKRKPL